jgi:hypothetical protein
VVDLLVGRTEPPEYFTSNLHANREALAKPNHFKEKFDLRRSTRRQRPPKFWQPVSEQAATPFWRYSLHP